MEKTLKFKAVKHEGEMPKEYEVTYRFGGWFGASGQPYIECEYEGVHHLRLTTSIGQLPKENWTFMIFHASMYWLVLPLLNAGIVKITYKTEHHPMNCQKNCLLVEVAEGYYTKKEDQK